MISLNAIHRISDYLSNAVECLGNIHLSDVNSLEEMSELMKIQSEIKTTYTKLDNFRMAKTKDITRKVRSIVESYLGPTDDPTEDFTELGLDSLDKLELICDVEKEFGISVNDSDVDKLTNLNKLQCYVLSRV